jgi:hypothetical protein
MKRALVSGFILGAVAAVAQDRTITVREVDVLPREAFIRIQADGGCQFYGTATIVAPSVEPVTARSSYAFNGARCTTVKNAITAAAKKDLGVGDGSDP